MNSVIWAWSSKERGKGEKIKINWKGFEVTIEEICECVAHNRESESDSIE